MFRRRSKSRTLRFALCQVLFALTAFPGWAQQQSSQTPAPHEMQLTQAGFLAVDTPKGWERSDGPGLVFFLKKGAKLQAADVWIYVSGYPIGPNEELKNVDGCIQSDVTEFQARFKNGTVRVEEPLMLPNSKTSVPVRTFLSGESRNAFEQVVYVAEQTRVLSFVLSAKTKQAYTASVLTFHEFAQSYSGSIIMGGDSKQP